MTNTNPLYLLWGLSNDSMPSTAPVGRLSPTEWFPPLTGGLAPETPAPAPMVTCPRERRLRLRHGPLTSSLGVTILTCPLVTCLTFLSLWGSFVNDRWPGKKYWQKFYYLQVVDIVSCLYRTKFIFHKCFHISSILFGLSRLYTSETFHKSQKLTMEYLNNTHTHAQCLLSQHKYYSKNTFVFH